MMSFRLCRTLSVAALLLVLAASPVCAGTLFVDANLTTGADDGSSWADAFQGPLGLVAAQAAAVSGDEIWVADGTYLPTDTGSRTVSFDLPNGVIQYGSFAGGESAVDQRPPFGTADSILSGDLAGDDGLGSLGDNSFHVVNGAGSNATAVLDGFVVRAGEATTGGSNRDRGAGILCIGSNASPTIRHCRFLDHRASFGGAAGYVNGGAAPSFSDCTFEDGDGGSFGGAFDIAGGGPVLYERCLFRGNTAARGGALEIFSTNGVIVDNCVFRDNVATGSSGGGGIWMGSGGNTRVRNCTIVSNTSVVQNNGGLRNQGATNATVSNTIFWDNEGPAGAQNANNQVNPATVVNYSIVEGTFGGGGTGNLDGDPLFVDAASGDYRLLGASPAIDAGDTSDVIAGALTDFGGLQRLVDAPGVVDTGVGPAPVVDIGAHEFGGSSPWTDLGQGLPGTGGLTPLLVGSGDLTAGAPTTLVLSDALPGANAWLVVGFSDLSAPFKGGVLVPDVDLLLGPLAVDGAGGLPLGTTWPLGVPSGFQTWWQEWVQDGAGPVGFAASNAVLSVTP